MDDLVGPSKCLTDKSTKNLTCHGRVGLFGPTRLGSSINMESSYRGIFIRFRDCSFLDLINDTFGFKFVHRHAIISFSSPKQPIITLPENIRDSDQLPMLNTAC